MNGNSGYALARAELIHTLTAYQGITTADGAPGGTTLIDANLIGSNDFITEKTILIWSGPAANEDKGAISFNTVTGQITLQGTGFSAQITAGTIFRVLNISSVEIDVSTINTKLGTNVDLPGTTTVFAYLAALLAALPGPAAVNQGLCYYGVVTGVPGADQFEIATLADLGAAKFATVVPEYQYHAFVLRDGGGGGAAPQGESQPVTNYGTATGNFSADPFTVPVAIGDEILIIHPYLARIMNFAGLPPHVGSTPGNWQAAEADIVSIGVDNVSYKLHSLVLDINALVGTVTIRMYQEVVGVERRVYQVPFTVAADGPGLWIVNGTVGIHEVLRVTAQSDNAADNGQAIGYDYMLEEM